MHLNDYFRRHIALPQDHGAWVFLLSPLIIGLFASPQFTPATVLLILASLAAFLVRQPVTMVVKIFSGRRSRRDLNAAYFWILVYGSLALLSFGGLIVFGYGYLFLLFIPAMVVFGWHLFLVSRRAERRQVGVEIVASGVLAFVAPAAYWVGIGEPDPTGWWLFILSWLQSAASIVYAYLRLEQRELTSLPGISLRLRMASRALLYTSFNLIFSLILSLISWLPEFIFLPYLLQWLETIWGSLRPAIGVKPTRIGVRQLIISSLFTILFVITWNL